MAKGKSLVKNADSAANLGLDVASTSDRKIFCDDEALGNGTGLSRGEMGLSLVA